MKRKIKKVAILGSGIMGSRIACQFANIGVQVLLLDINPRELSDKEKSKGLTLESKAVRNRIVNEALLSTVKAKPKALYSASFKSRITTGNFEDDMPKIADCDWVMEVVVENLKIKKTVFEQVEKHRKQGSLITSNTSGIPIHLMSEGRSEDFKQHFCGTHFFNPPRYLRLLELIPIKETKTEVLDFIKDFGSLHLGKKVVSCKDTPAFIANRIGIFSILKVIDSMNTLGLSIEDVDKLTGPVIGRPKSATFRTSDVVGLDTLAKVAENLNAALKDDEAKDMFNLPESIKKLLEHNFLGDKTKQGFYKKTKNEKGEKEILSIDFDTMEYTSAKKSRFPSLALTKTIDNPKDRFPVLLAAKDKAGEFYRDSFFSIFSYISNRIPEITQDIYQIDDALKAGFGWEVGPFETWDACNVEKSISLIEDSGNKPAKWVYEMLESGCKSFFTLENGKKKYYDIPSKSYKEVPGQDSFVYLSSLKKNNDNVVWKNEGTSLIDLGDGVVNLEFHTKMNTMGSEVIMGLNEALDIAEDRYDALVIANEGTNFSAGANLALIFMHAIEQEFDEIEMMINAFQQTMMRLRYSSIPTVAGTHGLVLGGGCELALHADAVQAFAETYIGLVEVGVGLIPAGGGTKEMTLRVSDSIVKGDVEFNRLQEAFMNIATAKVAESAHEAVEMGYFTDKRGISINRDRVIADAKAQALLLVERGYTQPVKRTDIKVEGKAGIAGFLAGIHGMRMGNYISDHDALIASKIAKVMSGGELSAPTTVSEDYLLDLEREAFLSLTGEQKTLERIQAILQTGKPLRN